MSSGVSPSLSGASPIESIAGSLSDRAPSVQVSPTTESLHPQATLLSKSQPLVQPTIDPRSSAAVQQLPLHFDNGVDAWPCAHCASKLAVFSRWQEERELFRREGAARRSREFLLKLPEVRAAFKVDRSRVPISRKYGKRCRAVYQACHSDWVYLHERKSSLRPVAPDLSRPLSPEDFKFYPSPEVIPRSRTVSPRVGSATNSVHLNPTPVQCAVAKDPPARVPIYLSKVSTSESASPQKISSVKALAKKLSNRVDSPISVSSNRSRSASISPKHLAPPSPVRKSKTVKLLKQVGSRATKASSKSNNRPKKSKSRNQFPLTDPNHRYDEETARLYHDHVDQRRLEHKRLELGRLPTPQCWCEYYYMLDEIYNILQEGLKRKQEAKTNRKERRALETQIKVKFLEEQAKKRYKRKKKLQRERRTAKLTVDPARSKRPDLPCTPWMQKLAHEIALAQVKFENPVLRLPCSSPGIQLEASRVKRQETETLLSSTLKELALLLRQPQQASGETSGLTKQHRVPVMPTSPKKVPSPRQTVSPRELMSLRKVPSPRQTASPRESRSPRKVPSPRQTASPRESTSLRKVPSPRQTASPRKSSIPPQAIFSNELTQVDKENVRDLSEVQTEPESSVAGNQITGMDYVVEAAVALPEKPQQMPDPISPRRPAQWDVRGGEKKPVMYSQQPISTKRLVTSTSQMNPYLKFSMNQGVSNRDRLTPRASHSMGLTFSSQARHQRVFSPPCPTPLDVTPSITPSLTPPYLPTTPEERRPAATGGSIVQLNAHPSYVPYKVPHFVVGQPSNSLLHPTLPQESPPSRRSSLPLPAFSRVEAASFPDSGFGMDRSVSHVQGSMGGDGADTPPLPPPRIIVNRQPEATGHISDELMDNHRFYEPHGEFFYLRNLGEATKFYRRQVLKDHLRRKKKVATTRQHK